MLHAGPTYYAFGTIARGPGHLVAARSADLASWTSLPDPLPRLPRWASHEQGFTWAPSVLARRGRYVLYYATRHAASGFQCVSRAIASSPEGPYDDDSREPFICPTSGASAMCGAIDPSPFLDRGRPYLLWKSDENSPACHGAPRLWAQPLSDDGLDVESSPTLLLTMDREWENPVVEGPSMLVHDGARWLFYSANWYESARYAVGYAVCDGPLGPCRKVTTEAPLLASRGAILGPGGQEFFEDPDGRPWMAYHAWTAPNAEYARGGLRTLRLAPVAFVSGAPVIGDPLDTASLRGGRAPAVTVEPASDPGRVGGPAG